MKEIQIEISGKYLKALKQMYQEHCGYLEALGAKPKYFPDFESYLSAILCSYVKFQVKKYV